MEALFLDCDLCAGPFLVCRPCGFNQRYCGPVCAREARAESVSTARKKYRDSEEGRAQHAAEERERRERQRQERQRQGQERQGEERAAGDGASAAGGVAAAEIPLSATCVGDQFVADPAESCMVPAMISDRSPRNEAPPRAECTVNDVGNRAVAELLQWTVITPPPMAALAAKVRARGDVMRCACCGRAGRVIAVVVKGVETLLAASRAKLRQRRAAGHRR